MNGRKQGLAFAAAIVIALVAGAFYFYVDDFAPTTSNRVEEPYKRTEDAPPSAVPDETSAPELKNSPNGANQP